MSALSVLQFRKQFFLSHVFCFGKGCQATLGGYVSAQLQRVFKRFAVPVAMLLVVALSGCATRPGPEMLVPVIALPEGSQSVSIFAVTDRASTNVNAQPVYGNGRGSRAYEQLEIGVASVPDSAKTSDLSKVSRNLAKDFVTLSRQQMGPQAFRQEILTLAKSNDRPIVLFVHGYNQSFEEAVFRMAQLSVDFKLTAVPILFSWPSQGNLQGYVADRDAAIYARDDLVDLLRTLGRMHSGQHVLVLAHSMGALLVMEALRQLRLEGDGDVLDELQIALAAPDIDIDVFKKQMSSIGKLSSPLTVMTSPDDRALEISAQLGENGARLGAVNVDDPATQALVQETGIRLFDIANLPASDGLNHDRFIHLAALYGSVVKQDKLIQRLQNAGSYILDASGAILSAPVYILTGVR